MYPSKPVIRVHPYTLKCKSAYLPVKVIPKNGLVKPVQGNLVLRSDCKVLDVVFSSYPKWYLLPSPVTEETEQAHAGHKEDDNGENAAHGGHQSPGQHNQLGGGATKSLLESDELGVQESTGENTPGDRDQEEGDGVNAESALLSVQ